MGKCKVGYKSKNKYKSENRYKNEISEIMGLTTLVVNDKISMTRIIVIKTSKYVTP